MIFTETKLKGAYVIDPERIEDERGFFARMFCEQELKEHGIEFRVRQGNVSMNSARGTLRGMHYQAAPYEEAKIVRCTRGALHDVIVDMRPESPTFRQYASVVLTADNHRVLYVPKRVAHGFLTLEDNTEVSYLISEFYHPEAVRGVRHNDPAFGIKWPEPVRVIMERDRNYPDFKG